MWYLKWCSEFWSVYANDMQIIVQNSAGFPDVVNTIATLQSWHGLCGIREIET